MTENEKRLKGGVGGKSTRMRERFTVETPSRDILQKYLVHYSGKDLYLGTEVASPTSETLFGNSRPLHMDLGCGRGEYAIMMAEQYPERNFVGIDYHAKSLYVGIHKVAELGLTNVRFLLADLQGLMPYIPSETVEKASVLFPAPIVNPRHAKNDVMRQSFIEQVHRILGEENSFLFVSDAEWYFQEKVKLMQDLELFALLLIQQSIEESITRYQKQWQSKGIPSNRAELMKLPSR